MNLKISINFEVYSEDAPSILNWEEAKEYCESLGEGWRLPTKDELNLMYEEHKKGVGSFTEDYYWSSSENDTGHVWFQNFILGNQYSNCNEYITNRVRAVRDIKI